MYIRRSEVLQTLNLRPAFKREQCFHWLWLLDELDYQTVKSGISIEEEMTMKSLLSLHRLSKLKIQQEYCCSVYQIHVSDCFALCLSQYFHIVSEQRHFWLTYTDNKNPNLFSFYNVMILTDVLVFGFRRKFVQNFVQKFDVTL